MRKTMVYILVLPLLLAGCGEKQAKQLLDQHSVSITCLSRSWAGESPQTLDLQRDLARWYNVNLESEKPEPGFQQAYNVILFYDDGIMGYVEIPAQELYIPIFHGIRKDGFSHDPESPIPIGDGGHSILRYEGLLELAEGEKIVLWILGEPMTYTVGGTGEDVCTLICGEIRYICKRMVED